MDEEQDGAPQKQQPSPTPIAIQLTGGAYSTRSVIASAQRCVNLYPEGNLEPDQPASPGTHYLTPGLVEAVPAPEAVVVRGLYRATTGTLYAVIGGGVYNIDQNLNIAFMGAIPNLGTPVSMSDNGIVVVLVDGSPNGYWWNLGGAFVNLIVDPAFYGARRVVYLDGFFVFNRPNTNQFYLSPSFWTGLTPFDGTYIASKIGGPDQIISIGVSNGNLWLIGQVTTEVWFNAGAADFPFQRQPGVFIEHGMLRGWTVAEADVELFWLGRDRQGNAVVMMGAEYAARRISNHAIENAIQSYGLAGYNDAIGFTYQQDGHTFYVLTFPNADHTWVYDLSTSQWHERTWTDEATGEEHRHRANCGAYTFGKMFVGDHTNGKIYEWSLDAYTDDDSPIVRRRGFPHVVRNGKQLSYASFIADMEVGGAAAPLVAADVMIRWSDTRGKSWGDAVPQSMKFGGPNQYDVSLIWRQLGMARDRVFELFWSFPYKTALNGAWIEVEKAET
jgi:hypothetical protein